MWHVAKMAYSQSDSPGGSTGGEVAMSTIALDVHDLRKISGTFMSWPKRRLIYTTAEREWLLNSVCKVGSRPSDHYFRSVCWFVCLSVCLCSVFLSRL